MLDIKFIRDHVDEVRNNLSRRQNPEFITMLESILALDRQLRDLQKHGDDLRKRRNMLSEEINQAKKAKKDATHLLAEVKEIPQTIARIEQEYARKTDELRSLLLKTPNLLHESVPYGRDDNDNVVVHTRGTKPTFSFTPVSHVDFIRDHDLADLERGAKIAGARWYFLKGKLAELEMALTRYAVDFMLKRGFTLVVPPHMMSRKAYEGVTSLADFEDALYKIEGEDLYVISTSEHPLTAMYMDEVLNNMPIKLLGYSTNFRKEAGSHSKDTKGIFRVHQFNKVEQIVICKPEDSWKIHEELRKNAEDFFESLGLHIRTVNVCTGDLGIVAAKKYDVEVWCPVQNTYREVVSCSNCTSYQATRLNIKFMAKDGTRAYVHTLNSTVVATTRALVALIENFQTKNGSVRIPKVLEAYLPWKELS